MNFCLQKSRMPLAGLVYFCFFFQIQYQFILDFEKPGEFLVSLAKKEKATGIVMGTRGLGKVGVPGDQERYGNQGIRKVREPGDQERQGNQGIRKGREPGDQERQRNQGARKDRGTRGLGKVGEPGGQERQGNQGIRKGRGTRGLGTRGFGKVGNPGNQGIRKGWEPGDQERQGTRRLGKDGNQGIRNGREPGDQGRQGTRGLGKFYYIFTVRNVQIFKKNCHFFSSKFLKISGASYNIGIRFRLCPPSRPLPGSCRAPHEERRFIMSTTHYIICSTCYITRLYLLLYYSMETQEIGTIHSVSEKGSFQMLCFVGLFNSYRIVK